jgi:competence protein ComEA
MFRSLLSRLALSTVLAVAVAHPPFVTAAAQSSSRSAKAPFSGTININTASATDLQMLPGIGAKTAALIVEYRQKNGPFKKVEELMNVRGIGEKNFLKLKPQITVTTAAAKAEKQNTSSN